MRLLLDEDVPHPCLEPLRHLLRAHTVDSFGVLGWKSEGDVRLYGRLAREGYDVCITNDRKQLEDRNIYRAIRRSGVHYVWYSQRNEGLVGLGLALGAVLAAVPQLLPELIAAPGQRFCRIEGLNPGRKRFEITDPDGDPPTYSRGLRRHKS